MYARAAVQTGPRQIEIQSLPVPEQIEPGEALLQVEACGMCGTDYEQYAGALDGTIFVNYPQIPGHEMVGRIARIGPEARRIWGVEEGDRVAVESFVPCGVCGFCLDGEYRFCRNRFMYSFTTTRLAPGLWGGYAEYMLLRPNTIVHRLPDGLSVEDAVLFNPLGAGFEWACRAAGVQVGDSVLIAGPGQRGLACVVACREAGAERIIVSGLKRDATKLALARDLGATDTVDVDDVDLVAAVDELTAGRGVDRAIDVSAFATKPITDAIAVTRPGGTIVLAGIKGRREVPGFISDELLFKGLHLVGVLGVGAWAYKQAIRVIASGRYPLARMHTHTLTIDELPRAMTLLAGEAPGEEAIHITIVPR